MLKQIVLVSVLFALALADIQVERPYKPSDLRNLTQGFNDQLAIQGAEDFSKCVGIPLVPHIQKMLKHLNETKPNPVVLAADIMQILKDYQKVKAVCPKTFETYQDFFSNFVDAVQNNTKATMARVVMNIAHNVTAIESAVVSGGKNFHNEEYYDAGSDLGAIIDMALSGYI